MVSVKQNRAVVEMGEKATKGKRREVDPFVEAAAKARVQVEEFRLYMLRVARGYSNKQWTSWENWWRPIPDKYVIAFMHWKQEAADRTIPPESPPPVPPAPVTGAPTPAVAPKPRRGKKSA